MAMTFVPDEVLQRGRDLRAAGASWNAVGRGTGYPPETIRLRLDEEFAERQRARSGGGRSYIRKTYFVTKAQIAEMKAAIPRDTRSLQAKWMGDPLPGRSALDQRQAQHRGNATVLRGFPH
jgi:hypothetical protein